MENQLKKLIELGVTELTVKDGYATAVNPHAPFYETGWRAFESENLPPIPTNLPDGLVKIEDVLYVGQIKREGSNEWENEDDIPFDELLNLTDYTGRFGLRLKSKKEPVSKLPSINETYDKLGIDYSMEMSRKKQPEEVKPIESIEEGFFYDEDYYNDIVSYAEQLDEEIEDLPDDWSIKVNEAELQPIVVFTPDWIIDNISEGRFSEENGEEEYNKIFKALKDCIDFEKLNAAIPKLIYSTRKTYLITKEDLLEAIK